MDVAYDLAKLNRYDRNFFIIGVFGFISPPYDQYFTSHFSVIFKLQSTQSQINPPACCAAANDISIPEYYYSP
jgi:hypothetical protein